MKIKALLQSASFYLFIIFVLSFLVYLRALDNEFVYDDKLFIQENPKIQDISLFFNNLFDSDYFYITRSNTYRPIPEISYFVFYSLFGENTLPYHLFSILIHALNGILVFFILFRLSGQKTLALMSSLIFVSHPAISEAVYNITYNDELLFSFFYLLSLLMYLKEKKWGLFLSYIMFTLSLFSKEMAITLPAIIILYDLILNKEFFHKDLVDRISDIIKKRLFVYSGYILISAAYIYIRFFYSPLQAPMIEEAGIIPGFLTRFSYLPYQLFQFIKITFVPLNLNADRIHHYPAHYFTLENIISLMIFMGLIFIISRYINRSRLIVFAILWFFITLLPVLNLISLEHPIADRYLYLPVIGFSIVIASLINKYLSKNEFSTMVPRLNLRLILVFVIISLYSWKTVSRDKIWQDHFSLWTHTLQDSPGSFRAHNNLGVELVRQKKYDRAIEHIQQALEINPDREEVYLNMGNAYVGKKQYQKAVTYYQKAIQLNEDFLEAYMNLGVVYAVNGNLNKAINEWQKVLDIDPEHEGARENIEKAKARMKGR